MLRCENRVPWGSRVPAVRRWDGCYHGVGAFARGNVPACLNKSRGAIGTGNGFRCPLVFDRTCSAFRDDFCALLLLAPPSVVSQKSTSMGSQCSTHMQPLNSFQSGRDARAPGGRERAIGVQERCDLSIRDTREKLVSRWPRTRRRPRRPSPPCPHRRKPKHRSKHPPTEIAASRIRFLDGSTQNLSRDPNAKPCIP